MDKRVAVFVVGLCLGNSSATAAPVAADFAKMDQMIREAHAEDVLINGTTAPDELVAIHVPSKLRCRFFLGLGNLQYFADQQAVLCSMKRSTFNYSLSTFPVRDRDTLESVHAELRAGLADGRKTRDIPISKVENDLGAPPGAPPFVLSRFRDRRDYWRIAVVRSGDWWITSATLSQHPSNVIQMMVEAAEWSQVLKEVSAPAAVP